MTQGLYVHVPFCAIKCAYCDFYSVTDSREAPREAYVARVIEEIRARGTGEPADTVFFGGGTPSLLSPDQFRRVLGALRRSFRVSPEAEVTLEANPETVTRASLRGFRDAGANRISFGVQSLDDGVLRVLGRAHGAARAREAVAEARAAGFERVNVDLMFGLPGQTPERWRADLREILRWPVDHLSAYELTVEEGTAFGARRPALPDEAAVEAMWWIAMEETARAGLEHYEIANYARPGSACRHNLKYWRDEEFFGFGPAAWGQRGGRRTGNPRGLAAWHASAAAGFPPAEVDEPAGALRRAESLILNLRLREGCDEAAYAARHGAAPLDAFGAALAPHLEAGRLERRDGRLRLTERGLLVANEVWGDVIAAAA